MAADPDETDKAIYVAGTGSTSTEIVHSCPVCKEPIRVGARVCVHCKSDLSWRRFLGVGSTTLAMLTALVAVVGTVGPEIKKLTETDDSKISAVVVTSSRDSIGLLVKNDGNRLGLITSAMVHLPTVTAYSISEQTGLRQERRPGEKYSVAVTEEWHIVVMGFWAKGSLDHAVKPKQSESVYLYMPEHQDIPKESEEPAGPGSLVYEVKRDPQFLEKLYGDEKALVHRRACSLTLNTVSSSGSTAQDQSFFDCRRIQHLLQYQALFPRPSASAPAK